MISKAEFNDLWQLLKGIADAESEKHCLEARPESAETYEKIQCYQDMLGKAVKDVLAGRHGVVEVEANHG